MDTPRSGRIGRRIAGVSSMQDFIWIGIVLGLVVLSLAYVRLCDNA
jgi:hypothetical protein